MLALPAIPAALLVQHPAESNIASARAWGYRIGLAARDALGASAAIERAIGDRNAQVEAISVHFGLGNQQHSLHVAPLEWLRLGETLATQGLKHFLAASDSRAHLFLKAIAPEIDWPPDLAGINVNAETHAGRGRIDLLISGRYQEATWGAVIEAKFEHSIKSNPLPDYMHHGAKIGMEFGPSVMAKPTGALIVLGKRVCRQTRKRLRRNKYWRFVHWREVLRRFDAILAEDIPDEDFRRFRRTIWERAGKER